MATLNVAECSKMTTSPPRNGMNRGENMEEVIKLIEYVELSGFELIPNGDKLIVKNGKNLSPRLKRLLQIYKKDILLVLKEQRYE